MDGQLIFYLTFVLFTTSYAEVVNINDFLFSGGIEYLDLSHPFNNDTTYWPGARKFEFTKKSAYRKSNGAWIASNEFCAAEHGGTHLDAPYHFNPHGWTVGEIPASNLITPLIVLDLSTIVNDRPDFILQRHHLDHVFVGDSRRNFTLLLRFGWSKYYGNNERYFGVKTPKENNLNFPGISEDVAKWFVETKTLVGVGVDTASIDAGSELGGVVHTVFASHNIFVLENVNIPKTLLTNKCALIVMPMKIQDGTGAPCRLTAMCPRVMSDFLF